jgi:hypothetical protein
MLTFYSTQDLSSYEGRMKSSAKLQFLLSLLVLIASVMLNGCKNGKTRDTVMSSVSNPTHSFRATVLRRQYLLDNGMEDASPTTYVLLERDAGPPSYAYGQDFKGSDVVMRPSQCGPLRLMWIDDQTLQIICDKCDLALHSLGNHADKIGPIRIVYEGFPTKSFWE